MSIEDFLQSGRFQVAAGYIIYGTSTMLFYTTGNGVNGFTLNPAIGTFYHSHSNIQIPKNGNIYSINEGNYLQFPDYVKKYITSTLQEVLFGVRGETVSKLCCNTRSINQLTDFR